MAVLSKQAAHACAAQRQVGSPLMQMTLPERPFGRGKAIILDARTVCDTHLAYCTYLPATGGQRSFRDLRPVGSNQLGMAY
jgi:hypothetical protein